MKFDRPIIGITTSIDRGLIIRTGHDYLYLKRTYPKCIAQAGGYPVLLSSDMPLIFIEQLCDALVIPGGNDLPSQFGKQEMDMPDAELPERIIWERELLNYFVASGKPILGVCYGMQLINLHFGGTLISDIYSCKLNVVDHGGAGKTTSHPVSTVPHSTLQRLLGTRVSVSSAHHQAVDKVADIFQIAAKADDGVIEAFESDLIMAVEWHPESDPTGLAIYGHLVALARSQ